MQHYQLKPSRTIGDMLEYMLEQILDHPEWNEKEKLIELGHEFLEKQSKGESTSNSEDTH
jgi:hypothetical protein